MQVDKASSYLKSGNPDAGTKVNRSENLVVPSVTSTYQHHGRLPLHLLRLEFLHSAYLLSNQQQFPQQFYHLPTSLDTFLIPRSH